MRSVYVAFGWGLVAAIVWLSLTPRPPQVDVEQGDKLGHLIAYGALMFWFCLLYPKTKTRLGYGIGFIAMGIAIEFAQNWTGYRSFEVADMVADAAGVALGLTAGHFTRLRL